MANRDVGNLYRNTENLRKLERLVASLKAGEPYEIKVAGERTYVGRAGRILHRVVFSIEHEVEDELESQPLTNG